MSDTVRVKVGPKGRVVIPIAARQALGISEGDELAVVVEDDGVRLVPRDRLLRSLRGVLKSPSGPTGAVDGFIEGRRREAKAEEAELTA